MIGWCAEIGHYIGICVLCRIIDLFFCLKNVYWTLSLAVVAVFICGVVVRLLGFRPDLRSNIQSLCVWLFLFMKIELNQGMGWFVVFCFQFFLFIFVCFFFIVFIGIKQTVLFELPIVIKNYKQLLILAFECDYFIFIRSFTFPLCLSLLVYVIILFDSCFYLFNPLNVNVFDYINKCVHAN